jgi:hypothetical protein
MQPAQALESVMFNLPTRDYAKIADALENFPPVVDGDGRGRVFLVMSPDVLRHIRDGLRRLSRIEAGADNRFTNDALFSSGGNSSPSV